MPCDSPLMIDNPRKNPAVLYIPIPCGRCPVCQRNRVTSWVFRCMAEDKVSLFSHFVTLTYDPLNLPKSPKGRQTLRPRDLTLFWKRLRKAVSKYHSHPVKYYAVGEYGGVTWRPHYHCIVFNVPHASFFQDAWPHGHVDIGNVSDKSIGYTAGYINKASTVPAFKGDDRVKEFSRMSKGLGASYLDAASIKYHKADVERNYITLDGGCKIPLPRYYRDKIYSEDEKKLQRDKMNEKYLERDHINEREFRRKYGDHADYHRYLEYLKIGRYKNHSSKRNKRNKL